MFCTNCGKELPDNARFCAQCGAPVPEVAPAPEPPKAEPPRPAAPAQTVPPEPVSAGPDGVDTVLKEMNLGKKSGKLAGFLIGVVAAAVVFALAVALKVGMPSGGSSTVEGDGFDTPEEAVDAYLGALKEGNLDGALSAFAMESYVENMDLEAYVERLGIYMPGNMPLSGEGDYADALNLELRRSDVTKTLMWQYVTLVDPNSPILEMQGIPLGNNGPRALLESLIQGDGMEILSSLEIGDFQQPERLSESYSQAANQENIAKQEVCYGADEIQPLAVEVTVDGRAYLFCPDAIRYGDSWYLLSPGGNLAILLGAATTTGGFVPMDELF